MSDEGIDWGPGGEDAAAATAAAAAGAGLAVSIEEQREAVATFLERYGFRDEMIGGGAVYGIDLSLIGAELAQNFSESGILLAAQDASTLWVASGLAVGAAVAAVAGGGVYTLREYVKGGLEDPVVLNIVMPSAKAMICDVREILRRIGPGGLYVETGVGGKTRVSANTKVVSVIDGIRSGDTYNMKIVKAVRAGLASGAIWTDNDFARWANERKVVLVRDGVIELEAHGRMTLQEIIEQEHAAEALTRGGGGRAALGAVRDDEFRVKRRPVREDDRFLAKRALPVRAWISDSEREEATARASWLVAENRSLTTLREKTVGEPFWEDTDWVAKFVWDFLHDVFGTGRSPDDGAALVLEMLKAHAAQLTWQGVLAMLFLLGPSDTGKSTVYRLLALPFRGFILSLREDAVQKLSSTEDPQGFVAERYVGKLFVDWADLGAKGRVHGSVIHATVPDGEMTGTYKGRSASLDGGTWSSVQTAMTRGTSNELVFDAADLDRRELLKRLMLVHVFAPGTGSDADEDAAAEMRQQHAALMNVLMDDPLVCEYVSHVVLDLLLSVRRFVQGAWKPDEAVQERCRAEIAREVLGDDRWVRILASVGVKYVGDAGGSGGSGSGGVVIELATLRKVWGLSPQDMSVAKAFDAVITSHGGYGCGVEKGREPSMRGADGKYVNGKRWVKYHGFGFTDDEAGATLAAGIVLHGF